MFSQTKNPLEKTGSTLSNQILTVNHQCDDFPETFSPQTFTMAERQAIISAAKQITPYYVSTLIWESELIKSIQSFCDQPKGQELIASIISQASTFFAALDANKDVGARISATQKLIDDIERLGDQLGEEKFALLMNQLYLHENKNSHLRVLPLILTEIQNHAAFIRQFMTAELMGHGVAYQIAQHPAKINTLIMQSTSTEAREAFSVREIPVKIDSHENTSLRDKSLIVAILTPIYEDGKIPEQPTIYISWTGTYDENTLFADLQRNAGEESYRHAEQQLMHQIMQALAAFKAYVNRPFRVVITGHSLGGALSQLSFHSLQRQLAASITTDNAALLEADTQFISALQETVADYKGNVNIGRLSPNKGIQANDISELCLAVWNPTGILEAVEINSNVIAPALRQKAGIRHKAFIGHVGGDAVQVTGQATILSDIEHNGVEFNVFKIEPNTLRFATTLGGLFGGGFFGALVFSSLFAINPLAGAVVGFSTAAAAIAKKSFDAHTMKHFAINFKSLKELFAIPYRLFTSHTADGALNLSPTTGYQKVKQQISRKSFMTDTATKFIHAFGLLGNRNNTPSSSANPNPPSPFI